jgi:Rrf2 family transcriptional regulator, iron-sulfur cluster assembly transcription factor
MVAFFAVLGQSAAGDSMMTLSTTVGYAIQALACLASSDASRAMIHNVAECAKVPAPYLAKIMKRLNDAGIVVSKRGFKGGIWLSRPPEKITLIEVMNAVDGPQYLSGCLLGNEFCSDERDCPTHAFWKSTREQIRVELASNTLADVVAFNARRSRQRQAQATRRAAKASKSR